MGAQIPVIVEKPLAVCGSRKFKVDALGDHLCTCTAHSGAKKVHDCAVDQLADLFRTTHKVKTQQVVQKPRPPLWGRGTNGISGECVGSCGFGPGPPHRSRSLRK